MLAVSVLVVGVVSSLIVGVVLALLAYLFAHLVKTTKRSLEGLVASRWLTWLGILIVVYGAVDIVWSQFGGFTEYTNVADRVNLAATGVIALASGALVVIGAQIVGSLQAAARRQSERLGV